MPLESIRFANGTLPLEGSQASIQGEYGLLRFSRNKPCWDSVSSYIHPPKYYIIDEKKNVPRGTPLPHPTLFRIILNWYWVPVSLRLPSVFWDPVSFEGCAPYWYWDSVSLRRQGWGGSDFLWRYFSIYINMAIKKYVTHRTLDLTALINQVIHKEFSWSSFPPAWGSGFIMYHRCIVSHNILDT